MYIKSCERLHSISAWLLVFHHALERFRPLHLIHLIPFCIYLRVFPMKSVLELSSTWLLVLVLDLSFATYAVPRGSWQSSERLGVFLPFLPSSWASNTTDFVCFLWNWPKDRFSESFSRNAFSIFLMLVSFCCYFSCIHSRIHVENCEQQMYPFSSRWQKTSACWRWWGTGKCCPELLSSRDFTDCLTEGNSRSLPWLLWSTCVIKIYKAGMHNEW